MTQAGDEQDPQQHKQWGEKGQVQLYQNEAGLGVGGGFQPMRNSKVKGSTDDDRSHV